MHSCVGVVPERSRDEPEGAKHEIAGKNRMRPAWLFADDRQEDRRDATSLTHPDLPFKGQEQGRAHASIESKK